MRRVGLAWVLGEGMFNLPVGHADRHLVHMAAGLY